MTVSRTTAAVVSAALLALLAGCGSTPTAAPPEPAACEGVPAAAPFDERAGVTRAENLDVSYVGGAAVVTVAEPFQGGPAQTIVLTRCGQPDPQLPPELADAPRVATPVTSLYSGSSTHLPMLADLDRSDVVTGVSSGSGIVSPEVREGVAAGEVAEFAGGGTVDLEAVLTARPDVLVTAGVDDPAYPRLTEAGIPVVPNAEWLEATPLGRAEWVVLFGLLTGAETQAAEEFAGLARDYEAVRARVAGVPPTPLVPGQLAAGTFAVPSGGSYVGALLTDAGGTYPWADRPETGSLRLSLEEVLTSAGEAPVWLTTATTWTTREDARRDEPRHDLLAAMGPGGQAWTASLATTPDGANDWFERGVTRPDLALGDLAAILHPDRFPGHEFTFYRPLTGP